MKVYDLRTLKLTNPIGIEQTPTFSWKLSSDKTDSQTAYRIIVKSGGKTVWDSDKL